MRRSAFGLSLLPVLSLVSLALASSCEERFEAPCRVTRETVLVTDPTIGARSAIALHRSKDHAVGVWPHRDLVDAGDAGAPLITSLEVANVDAESRLAWRANVAVPAPLLARRGSVDDVDVLVEDGAFATYWVETTTTTMADGRVRSAAAVKAAYALDGNPANLGPGTSYGAPITVTTCEKCEVRVATVALAASTLVLTRIDPDLRDSAAPSFVAHRVSRDGTVSTIAIPWLTLPADSDGGLANSDAADLDATLDREGRIVVTTGGRAWRVDDSLALLSGPISLPATDALVAWESEASVAWSIAPSDDGRAALDVAPREIFVGSVPVGGGSVATRQRVSRGRTTLALDRAGGDVGVAFESAGRIFLASVDSSGNKRGGDVLVGATNIPANSASEFGTPVVPEARTLFVRQPRQYSLLTLGLGRLVATEVRCEAP